MYLLNSCYVALVAGTPSGNPECVRISYAASEENLLKAINSEMGLNSREKMAH